MVARSAKLVAEGRAFGHFRLREVFSMRRHVFTLSGVVVCAAVAVNAGGCGGDDGSSEFKNGNDGGVGDDSTGGDDGSGDDGGPCFGTSCGDGGGGDATPQCRGLQCQVNKSCAGGVKTSISGTVYDPRGYDPDPTKTGNPLYNIVVYVPTDPMGTLPPITPGTNSCNTCDANIGDIVTATLTDENGKFTLNNVPTGMQIPVVFQVGKWRREIFLQSTADCMDTPIPAGISRLPRNQTEGSMPQMAVLTGGCDPLACLFKRIGVDDVEFTNPGGTGRMHVYKGIGGGDVQGGGAGDCTGATCPLWNTKAALEKYDIGLLSCECSENNQTKSVAQKQAMHDWIDEGGKVFATHFHYTWFKNGPADFANTANWTGGSTSAPFTVDTTFPKGQSFVKWLIAVGAIAGGTTIPINAGDVKNDVGTLKTGSQRWIYASGPESVKYFTFNTPIGGVPPGPDAGPDAGNSYCGKAVMSDIHVSGSANDATTVPTTCQIHSLTPQEKALEFLFFDLSSCVTDDTLPPEPPMPPK
jgi:hypothetical protein